MMIYSLSLWTLCACFFGGMQANTAQESVPVRVMSFNIRYGTAPDGANRWENRKEFLVETIKAFDPDLLGTQETLAFQRDYLSAHLPGYEAVSAGRDDGKEKGEMAALFFKKDRFEKLDAGHFWLSESPDKPGSKSWDSSLPRIVTWVKLRDRKGDQKPIVFLNTHFDHRGAKARLESARLIRNKIGELAKGCSVILTGDFNTGEGTPPYSVLFGSENGGASPVVDTYRKHHPKRQKNEGTFSGFKSSTTAGARIDWIACSPDWTVLTAQIDRTQREGTTPSDHFPVTAVVRR